MGTGAGVAGGADTVTNERRTNMHKHNITRAKRAITYLRVSTRGQAKRGGEVEGFSIPAQREACHRKAESLDASVVEEFKDAGASAKSAERPDLKRMLEYLAHNEVDFVIVHKLDRLARNRMDDVQILAAIQAVGATLVSCSENIDETPSGTLVHGIMSSIAEFYSKNLATEAKKGMGQKAKAGGTPGRAPFGYLNATHRDEEGREVRTVVLDDERAKWVKWLYERYATGEWTIGMLRDELEIQGVTTFARPKQPARSLSASMIHSILRNPYYTGVVTFGGAAYPGRHEAVVEEELWAKVESIRRGRNRSKEKPVVRTHYLKGSLFCGKCGEALTYEIARNRVGTYYAYFYCLGRQVRKNGCTFVSIQAHHAEALVEDHWRAVAFGDDTLQHVRQLILDHIDTVLPKSLAAAKEAEASLAEAAARSDRLMQAYYAGAIDVETLRKEQDQVRATKRLAERRIEEASLAEDKIRVALDASLQVLHDGYAQYVAATDQSRRDLNQAVFERIYLDDDEVTGAQPSTVYNYLLDDRLEERLASEANASDLNVPNADTDPNIYPSGVLRQGLGRFPITRAMKNTRPVEDGCSNVTLLVGQKRCKPR